MLLYCIWLSTFAVIRSSDSAMSPIAVEPLVKLSGVFMAPGPVTGVPPMPFLPVKPTKVLGETCEADGECASAFAQCAAFVCTCRDGFEISEKGLCTPKSYSCPIGEPLLNNGRPMRCQQVLNAKPDVGPLPAIIPQRKKRMSSMMPGAQFNDSCPDTYFCLVHNNNYYESSSGHCCPSPKVVCPVGEALNASCSHYDARNVTMSIISAAQFAPNMEKRCPYETHYCQSIMIRSRSIGKDACCPKPCSDQDIYHEGKCYARGRLAGETCTIQQQCENSLGTCVSGTCQCKKGYVNVGAGYCHRPYCTGVDANQIPLEPLITAVGDFMRCNASTECPSSAYCTGYDQICCPVPKPTCPQMDFGPQQPNGECDPTNFNNKQCGSNGYCYRYYYATETMSTDGGVCCDSGRMSVGLPMEPGPRILQASQGVA